MILYSIAFVVFVLLACIGIVIVLGGIFAFLDIRKRAERIARDVATEISGKTAEEVNKRVDEYFAEILVTNEGFMYTAGGTSDDTINQIAKEQENNS